MNDFYKKDSKTNLMCNLIIQYNNFMEILFMILLGIIVGLLPLDKIKK